MCYALARVVLVRPCRLIGFNGNRSARSGFVHTRRSSHRHAPRSTHTHHINIMHIISTERNTGHGVLCAMPCILRVLAHMLINLVVATQRRMDKCVKRWPHKHVDQRWMEETYIYISTYSIDITPHHTRLTRARIEIA